MYSFHSSLEEKNQLLHTLTTYGIETTVDRSKKKDRIRQWIQASAIVEENEGDESSDIYEDSEFYDDDDDDEDRDNDGNGSEEAESFSMRGRHFPERRPSAATNNPRKRRGSSRLATGRVESKTKVPVKPVERKIPFAPQVAEERETIAHFASFPNGDPNLAAVSNGGDRAPDLSATSSNVVHDISPLTVNNFSSNPQSSVSSINGRGVKDPARTSANNSRDASPLSAQPVAAVPIKQSGSKTAPSVPDSGSRTAPMSPQIPARKNRAHTAPFLDARSAESRANLVKRTQSATVSRTPETEEPPLPPRAPGKTSVSPHPTTARADNPSVLSTSRAGKAIASPVARADRAPAAPIGNSPLAESQPPNSTLPGRVEGMPPSATQITTSAASHLQAMQSFNVLQGIAGASSAVSPNVSKRAEEMNVAYGKDAYEHYGIAQGVILPMRVNVVRQDSTGSGSRSVSN